MIVGLFEKAPLETRPSSLIENVGGLREITSA
jgi:hypothetical protein